MSLLCLLPVCLELLSSEVKPQFGLDRICKPRYRIRKTSCAGPQRSAAVDSGLRGSRIGAQRWGTAVGSGCFGTLPGELIKFQKINIFSLLICCPVFTLGPKKCSHSSVEHQKTAARSHDGEHGGCSVLIFALKAAELIINADKIMARMTKPLLPHSKS